MYSWACLHFDLYAISICFVVLNRIVIISQSLWCERCYRNGRGSFVTEQPINPAAAAAMGDAVRRYGCEGRFENCCCNRQMSHERVEASLLNLSFKQNWWPKLFCSFPLQAINSVPFNKSVYVMYLYNSSLCLVLHQVINNIVLPFYDESTQFLTCLILKIWGLHVRD
jgi:hypothetical protein